MKELLRPTAAQRRAADPAISAWVTANAGTGKTHVLSDRVVRLMLAGARPEGILCLTFTRAAAVQMAERIEERLARWAIAPEEVLRAELEGLLGEMPDAETLLRARSLFARLLELPEGLWIQTIHAFCGALLRRFPLEAGVPPHFEAIDERTARELFAEARHQVIERHAQDGEIARALEVLALTGSDRTLFEALDSLLGQRIRLAELERRHGGVDGVIAAVARALGISAQDDEDSLWRAVESEPGFAIERLKQLEAALLGGNATQRRLAEVVARWIAADAAQRRALRGALLEALVTREGTMRKALLGGRLEARAPEAAKALCDLAEAACQLHDRLRAVRSLRRLAALLRVGYAVLRRYDELRALRAALDYDDLIAYTRRLLADPAQVAWVLYKLDARIEHILVDEAQDTSPEQWEIVERLLDEFFAGAGAHDRPRTFFAVGDEKQSIYSFQGADLANYRRVKEKLFARARACGHPLEAIPLELSFRSTEAVLDFVDRLLELQEAREGVVPAGERVRHLAHRRGVAGAVEVWPLLELEEEEPDPPWPLPDRPRPLRDPEAVLAKRLARRIRHWLERGEMLEGRGRPMRPGDIMILVQRRGTLQELLVRALKTAGVPVAGVDRMRLADHLAVRDLLALGRAVLLPEDDYTFACLLKSPLLDFGEEELFALAHGRGAQHIFERLRERAERGEEPFVEAWDRFAAWRRRADWMPPFEFFTWVLGPDGGRRRLLRRLGPDAAEAIEAFLAQTLAYEEGHPATLEGFLHWFGMAAQELVRDPERGGDAVRVVTVHGAKGLEAPVVILADAGPHRSPRRGVLVWGEREGEAIPFWRGAESERPRAVAAAVAAEKRRELEENRRLLYVAATRAEDRLYIVGCRGRGGGSDRKAGDNPPPECWHEFARRVLDAAPGTERTAAAETARVLGREFAGEILAYRRGQPAEAEAAPAPEAPPPALPSWASRPPGPETEAAEAGPDEETEEEVAVASERSRAEEERLMRGRMMHRLLQLLPEIAPERRGTVAEMLLAREAPELAGRARELCAEAEKVLALPELRPFFGASAYAEQTLAGRVEGELLIGRVDRFAVDAETIWLLDYKSEDPPPRRLPEAYLHQLAAYGAVLRALYPGRKLRAAIVWTAIPRVEWVDLAF